jgi:hypothetical protein
MPAPIGCLRTYEPECRRGDLNASGCPRILTRVDWNVLISAGAGVLGAAAGGGAILKVARDDRRERRAAERMSALVSLNAALGRLLMMYATWSDLQPKRDNVVTRARLSIQIFGFEKMIVRRLWSAFDASWFAIGRAYAVVGEKDISVIEDVESVLADWHIGDSMPDSVVPAIRRLRALLQGRIDPAIQGGAAPVTRGPDGITSDESSS